MHLLTFCPLFVNGRWTALSSSHHCFFPLSNWSDRFPGRDKFVLHFFFLRKILCSIYFVASWIFFPWLLLPFPQRCCSGRKRSDKIQAHTWIMVYFSIFKKSFLIMTIIRSSRSHGFDRGKMVETLGFFTARNYGFHLYCWCHIAKAEREKN